MGSNFQELKKLQTFPNLIHYLPNLESLWENNDQICLNTTVDYPDDYQYGVGTLSLPSDLEEIKSRDDKISRIIKHQLELEGKFTEFNSQFMNTPLEEIYYFVKSNFDVGRVRLMRIAPRKTMSWHFDTTKRLHYPIETYIGCRMVIENESVHLPADTWWITNTLNHHTAFNAADRYRIHLVACLL
jgi:hypothetical protein